MNLILFTLLVGTIFWTYSTNTGQAIRDEVFSHIITVRDLLQFNMDYSKMNSTYLDLIKSSVAGVQKDIKIFEKFKSMKYEELLNIMNTKKRFDPRDYVDLHDFIEYIDRLEEITRIMGIDRSNDYFIFLMKSIIGSYGIIIESIIFVIRVLVESLILMASILLDYNIRVIITYFVMLGVYSYIFEVIAAFLISSIRPISYKTARWEARSVMNGFSSYGFFNFIHTGVLYYGIFRVFLIVVGLPHYFNFDILYLVIVFVIIAFFLSMKSMEHTVKYQISLRIEGNLNIKESLEGQKWEKVLADNLLSWLYSSTLTPRPFFLRFREWILHDPKQGLRPRKWWSPYVFYLTLPFYIIIDLILEGVIQSVVWSLLYMYLYPRIKTIKLNSTTISNIMGLINLPYKDYCGEIINLNHSYFYNVIRFWAITCYYRTPIPTPVSSESPTPQRSESRSEDSVNDPKRPLFGGAMTKRIRTVAEQGMDETDEYQSKNNDEHLVKLIDSENVEHSDQQLIPLESNEELVNEDENLIDHEVQSLDDLFEPPGFERVDKDEDSTKEVTEALSDADEKDIFMFGKSKFMVKDWRKEIFSGELPVTKKVYDFTLEEAKDDLASYCLYAGLPFRQLYSKIFGIEKIAVPKYKEWIATQQSYDQYACDPDLSFSALPVLPQMTVDEIRKQVLAGSEFESKPMNLPTLRRFSVLVENYDQFVELVDLYSRKPYVPDVVKEMDIFKNNYKGTNKFTLVSNLVVELMKSYIERRLNDKQIRQAMKDFIEKHTRTVVWDKLEYRNLQSVDFVSSLPKKEERSCLLRLGTSKINKCPVQKVFPDEKLISFVSSQFPSEDVFTHKATSVNRELTLKALAKYSKSSFSFDLNSSYNGVPFKNFLFGFLDWSFGYIDRDVKVLSLSELTLDHISPASQKASAGMRMRASGYVNKSDRFSEQIEIARAFREETLSSKSVQNHYWAVIPVLKTHKKGDPKVRVALAPESYFYFNQFCLFYDFVESCTNCRVTNKFNPFFLNFNAMVEHLAQGRTMIETIDLVDMGGRIPAQIKDLFLEWYGGKIDQPEDKLMLMYLLEDIWHSKIVLPDILGGDVFEKHNGWNDGPYGTNQFDTFAMMCYFAMNIWQKLLDGRGEGYGVASISSLNFEVHGDNWAHSYPIGNDFFSWDQKFMSVIGQEMKEIVRDINPTAHELMGFRVKQVGGILASAYVGYRPFGKTLKSLCFRDKRYVEEEAERGYLAAIADCLYISDCWEDRSFRVIQEIRATYKGPRKPKTIEQQEKLRLLTKYGEYDPRTTYWLIAQDEDVEDTDEDILIYERSLPK